jgi:hypothetical protein
MKNTDDLQWFCFVPIDHEFLRSKVPTWRGHTGEELGALFWGETGYAQVAEVGREHSGAVKPDEKRGPKFRAPYSGYSLRQHPRLIPIKRVLHMRDLAVA